MVYVPARVGAKPWRDGMLVQNLLKNSSLMSLQLFYHTSTAFVTVWYIPTAEFGQLDLCRERRFGRFVVESEDHSSICRVDFSWPFVCADGLEFYMLLLGAWQLCFVVLPYVHIWNVSWDIESHVVTAVAVFSACRRNTSSPAHNEPFLLIKYIASFTYFLPKLWCVVSYKLMLQVNKQ